MDEFSSLSTESLKVAVGELNEEEISHKETDDENESLEDIDLEEETKENSEVIESNTQIEANDDGVEALKKLLKALSNEDVAASMKGMKININIELGGNKSE